jgi:hypothetical protein
MPFDSVLSRLEDMSKFDFPVAESAIYDQAGKEIAGYTAIRRGDTGSTLAVHRGAYKLTKHSEVLAPTIEILRSRLDLTDARVQDHVFGDGAKVLREIFLPAYRVNVGGHALDFRIRQENSYDGSSAYRMDAGAFRLICKNGLKIGTMLTGSYQKHTTMIDASAESGKLGKSLEFFKDEADTWRLWDRERINPGRVHALFKGTLAAQPTRAKPDHVNTKQLEILMRQWDADRGAMGETRWAVFNTATWWASHGEGRTRTAAQMSLQRESAVQEMTRSALWKQLAA